MNNINNKLFEVECGVTELLALLRIMDYAMIYCEENSMKYREVPTLLNTIIQKTEILAEKVSKI